MPGRAARRLVLLEEGDVGPADLREVVEDARARDAASDDGDLRLRERSPLPTEGRS